MSGFLRDLDICIIPKTRSRDWYCMVLQGLEEGIEVGRCWALHHPHPQMRSACKVLLEGWCWRRGRLGRGWWGVMAEKGGRGRYFGPQNLPSAWSLPS